MLWRHLIGYLPLNIAQAVAGFGGIFILTRLLTPEQFGLYSLVFSIVTITHSLSFTWIEAAVARSYVRAEADQRLANHLATAFHYLLIGTVIVGITGFIAIAALPFSAEMKTVLAYGLGSMLIRSFLILSLEARKAAREVKRYSIVEFFNVMASFGLGIAIVYTTDLKAAGPFAGLAISAGIALVFELPKMLVRAKGGKASFGELKQFFAYGMPLSLSVILGYILQAGDRFVISGVLGNAQVGIYAAGYGTANRGLDILFVWAGMAAGPLLIAALELGNPEKAREMAKKAFGVMAFMTFPAATGIALVAVPLANVMTGVEFREGAAAIIPWITLAGLMNGITTYYLLVAFTLSRRTGIMVLVTAIPAVLNIALNFALLPSMGLMGAVVATIIAYSVSMVMSAVIGRRHFVLPLPFAEVAKTGFACGLMAIAVLALPLADEMADFAKLLIMAATGMLVYGIAALALNLADCRKMLVSKFANKTIIEAKS
ncbi:MAG: oligosaccharide flippase family protein [Robiginitomaculum sp.]|nr:oligosaccharide flippase family protein [Robiginitomaculum sp.]